MELDSLLNFVSELLHTDVVIFDGRDFSFITNDHKSIHGIVMDKDLKEELTLLKHIEEPLIFEWNDKYTFSLVPYKEKTIVVGPVFLGNKETINIKRKSKEAFVYDDCGETTFKSLSLNVLLINDFVGNKHMSRRELYSNTFIGTEREMQVENTATNIIYHGIANEEGHHSYDRVAKLENCVKNGYVDLVYQVCEENLEANHGKTSENDFENSKTMSIVGITIITRAAINGGVNYELAYSLSDTYIRQVHKAAKEEELYTIYYQAALNFTQLVATNIQESKKGEGDDYYTSKTKQYINQHISSVIRVIDIADSLGVTPNYLSATFKKSTGTNIMDYVAKAKVKVAKRLLKYSSLEQSSIAFNLGFASQSHFCKVFKDKTGMTPREYMHNVERPKNK